MLRAVSAEMPKLSGLTSWAASFALLGWFIHPSIHPSIHLFIFKKCFVYFRSTFSLMCFCSFSCYCCRRHKPNLLLKREMFLLLKETRLYTIVFIKVRDLNGQDLDTFNGPWIQSSFLPNQSAARSIAFYSSLSKYTLPLWGKTNFRKLKLNCLISVLNCQFVELLAGLSIDRPPPNVALSAIRDVFHLVTSVCENKLYLLPPHCSVQLLLLCRFWVFFMDTGSNIVPERRSF